MLEIDSSLNLPCNYVSCGCDYLTECLIELKILLNLIYFLLFKTQQLIITLHILAGSPALLASQLFTDIQTGHSIIAIPILTPSVRFLSTRDLRPALKVQASLDGGQGGGKTPGKNGSGGKASNGGGKQASSGDGGGDDKLVRSQ